MKTNCEVLSKWSKEEIIVHFFFYFFTSLFQVLDIYTDQRTDYSFNSFVAPGQSSTVKLALNLKTNSAPISAGEGADKPYQLLKFMGKKEKKRY